MVILQVISDVHLEFESVDASNIQSFINKILTPPKSDKGIKCLAMLGDICCTGNAVDFAKYKLLITNLSPLYDYIFIVCGNHEYYLKGSSTPTSRMSTIQGINEKIERFCRTDPKLYFLNNKTILLTLGKRQYYISGATLWSYIKPRDRDEVQSMMNDYTYIYTHDAKHDKIQGLTPAKVVEMHKAAVNRFKKLIKLAGKRRIPVIILTHHKPYVNLHDKKNRYKNVVSQAYETDLKKLIKPPVVIWGYGHTHIADNTRINGVRVVSNPRGYGRQSSTNGFSKAFYLRI